MSDAIVVVNCGSSSVKLDVFDRAVKENPLSAVVERVGSGDARLKIEFAGEKLERALPTPAGKDSKADGHDIAIAALLDEVQARGFVPKGVGHRVVHGGDKFSASVVITDDVVKEVELCVPLAPLHNPANLLGIAAARARLAVPQVAVFDTAFHASLPPEAYLYALPRALHAEGRVRRYGFHGTSHRYVAERAAAFFARPLSTLRLVTLHLGNGCSACAVDHGHSVDTTMGMTPLEGLMMGTRSGDVDPAVVLKLARELGIDQAESLLNKQSGLLGVSGFSQDMRDLVTAAEDPNHEKKDDAALAIAMFSRRVRKTVGALACAMGGLDGIVFTGGIGEHSARVRAAVCGGLRVVGALLHEEKNLGSSSTERDLSTRDSRVRILVIPTDEERAIARDVAALLV